MKFKSIDEIKENLEELALRTTEILDFKVLAKDLDKDGFLDEDLSLVDLDGFRSIQNKLKSEGLFETGFNNFINLADEVDRIPDRLKNNIEKIILSIEQLQIFIEKEFLEKQKKELSEKKAKEEAPKELINKEPETNEVPEDVPEEPEKEDSEEELQSDQEAENDALYDEAEEE